MTKTVVISQPFLFPWVGLFEQLRLADVFVHYDDVQFSKGSFCNRVQIKTPRGIRWLTVPLRNRRFGQLIYEIALDEIHPWRQQHRALLQQAFATAPHRDDALELFERVYQQDFENLAELSIASVESVASYFGWFEGRTWLRSSQLPIAGRNSQRVLELVKHLGGTRYITGHGAQHYLDHEAFQQQGISVEYLDYQKRPYDQPHGAFTPFVSILDLIANLGRQGAAVVCSGAVLWQEFLARSHKSQERLTDNATDDVQLGVTAAGKGETVFTRSDVSLPVRSSQ